MQAMHCIRQLVACSASGMHEHYVAASLADWRAGLCACLLDMRTQVVKECCITLAFIAQQMEMKVTMHGRIFTSIFSCHSSSIGDYAIFFMMIL